MTSYDLGNRRRFKTLRNLRASPLAILTFPGSGAVRISRLRLSSRRLNTFRADGLYTRRAEADMRCSFHCCLRQKDTSRTVALKIHANAARRLELAAKEFIHLTIVLSSCSTEAANHLTFLPGCNTNAGESLEMCTLGSSFNLGRVRTFFACAINTARGLTSRPKHVPPLDAAAYSVRPVPQNGSSTTEPGFTYRLAMLKAHSSAIMAG